MKMVGYCLYKDDRICYMNTAPPSPLDEGEQLELAGLLKLARLATNCVARWTAEACHQRGDNTGIQDPESSSG